MNQIDATTTIATGDLVTAPGEDVIVLGRYRLGRRLGTGGFGVVWAAHDELLRREVAVKRIALAPGGDLARAEREARLAARLAHPSIVALYEACAQGDAFYLISELIDGRTLADLIASDAIDDETVLRIGVAVGAALSHAHDRGVIHRDVKPQNVLVPMGEVAAEDRVSARRHRADAPTTTTVAAKLTDFGGARLIGDLGLTHTGEVLGTLAYMAPEQIEGSEAGPSADLYSLALVLYEALCGVNPVRGATHAATARRIGRPIASLGTHRRDLPRGVIDGLDRALTVTPGRRGTTEELCDELQHAVDTGLRTRWLRRRDRGPLRVGPSPPASGQGPLPVPGPTPGAAGALRTALMERPLRRVRPSPPADEVRQGIAPAPPPAIAADRPRGSGRGWRLLWRLGSILLVAWQAAVGHPGVALVIAVALAPVVVLYGRPGLWPAGGLLAPLLGMVGMAGAFVALAGQAPGPRSRFALGAIGFWWTVLAEALLSRRLWWGVAASVRHIPDVRWERSLSVAATHLIDPSASLAVAAGALVWAIAAMTLPWLVRGRHVGADLVAATVWAAGTLVVGERVLEALSPHVAATPRDAIVATVTAGALAVASRAWRGPVSSRLRYERAAANGI